MPRTVISTFGGGNKLLLVSNFDSQQSSASICRSFFSYRKQQ